MGIVVSEDTNRGRNEQQKIDAIVAENDYGLVMVTLDQISIFLGSWWATSLTGRIQTFRSYAHVPITWIMSHERASLGALGFYFAGVPAWAISTCLSICRHHPLERLIATIQNYFPNNDTTSKLVRASFTILHTAARGFLLVLAMQTYMYSLLQSLHLVHPASFPGIGYFLPLGNLATILLPCAPSDISVHSLGNFVMDILKTPSLFYIYVYLRPVIEVRLYRLIRRRLPKPRLTNDLSIKVAFDNDLIDWMVPTLGRRGEEETQRSKLSLIDDLLHELDALRQWLSSKFTRRPRRGSHASNQSAELQQSIEAHQSQIQSAELPTGHEQQTQIQRSAQPDPMHQPMLIHGSNAQYDGGDSGVMSNEENQIPREDSVDILRRARNLTISTRTSSPDAETHQLNGNTNSESRRVSRSDTLLSRSASPASSQSSPRVRAQLIQSSDIIAMQLELGSRQTHDQRRENGTPNAEDDSPNSDAPAGRRSISDLLDTLLSNQGQNLGTIVISDTASSDGLSNMTTAVYPDLGELATAPPAGNQARGSIDEHPLPDPTAERAVSTPLNALPDVVGENPPDDTTNPLSEPQPTLDGDDDNDNGSGVFPHIADPAIRQNLTQGTSTPTHRVTILSALPVDSLASHLASMITTAMFAPLESFYLRSLASSYLASAGASGVLRSDVYRLGAWGGGSSRSDKLAYMGKLALMMGIQAAVNASVWGIISGTAIRIGRRWCGWGAL
ncbi:uncharacterized protein BJX67DRAFT_71663 [Aspergillus lucknowensis]|uniref:Uncharacterized protein n=1 Tax=Aspergillus lucknowensis TaxID=176173 RepID=A0ABR4LTT6_9EURO